MDNRKIKIKLFSDVTVIVEILTTDELVVSTYPDYLASHITVAKENDNYVLYLFDYVFAIVNLEKDEPTYVRSNITAFEIRNEFERIKDLPSQERNAFSTNINTLHNSTEKNLAIRNDTDLHTHFLEVLSGKEFMEVMEKFTDEIQLSGGFLIPAKNEAGASYSIKELKEHGDYDEVCSQLSIDLKGQVPFDELHNVASKRTKIINYAIERTCVLRGMNPRSKEDCSTIRSEIYIELLKKVIEVYKSHDIKYVELSYSTKNTIMAMVDYLKTEEAVKLLEDLKVGFLFSVSRRVTKIVDIEDENERKKSESFNKKKISKAMQEFKFLIEHDYVVGFDLMGEEFGMTYADITDLKDPKTFISIINNVLSILNGREDKVLRLHAGENEESRYNPLYSLRVINQLKIDNNYILPQIRIGHGLYMPEDPRELDEYAKLLKDLNVVVEINATSNFTLSNVKSLGKIPYTWYVEHDIPTVLGTDGPGMYLTDPKQERFVARTDGSESFKFVNPAIKVGIIGDYDEDTDSDFLQDYDSNPQGVIQKVKEKFKPLIEKISFLKKLLNKIEDKEEDEVEEDQIVKNAIEEVYVLPNNRGGNDLEDIFQNNLLETKNELYSKSNLGIPYEDYVDYLTLIAYDDSLLMNRQLGYFDYVQNSIDTVSPAVYNDKIQVLNSVKRLEGYLFDIQSNELKYNRSELNSFYAVLDSIKEYIAEDKIAKAKMIIVALQMYFGLNVDFLTTLKRIIMFNIPLERILTDNYQRDVGLESKDPNSTDGIGYDDMDNGKGGRTR